MRSQIVIAASFSLLLAFASRLRAAEVDFLRDVRPILSGHCFKCHGPDESTRKAGLRLDVREAALKPAKSGETAIVPNNGGKSELLKRILTADEDEVMPPPSTKNPLTNRQKDILKQWIAEGAEYKPHWAFEQPKQTPLPKVKGTAWPQNEIDYFVLARLQKEGLKPSPKADKYTLVRRLYLDLIGLPPTPAQADAFVNDSSANAFETLVDSLLASPHYGERWARRWLDLARYADTNGYEKDRPRSIWSYRDWVIKALNADMPFDQFTVEQIAGDMLPDATLEQKIATGFHRNTMLNEEGGIDPLEYRFYSMVDRVHVTATTWLGLTMACAQCHTHKYDPIQHTEYYQFMAFMNNADEPKIELPDPTTLEKRKSIEAKIAKLEAALVEKFPAPLNIEWLTPANPQFASKMSEVGELLPDGSFRVSGPGSPPKTDTYTLSFRGSTPRLTHVQVEAIPDEKVGKGGPGRTDHGNFVLTEIEVEVKSQAGTVKGKFDHGEADVSQDGLPPENAFDGKANTGWAVGATDAKRLHRHAIFKLAEPIQLTSDSEITVRLHQDYGDKHTLGRFRITVGNDLSSGMDLAEARQKHLEEKFSRWISNEGTKIVAWKRLRPAEARSDTPVLTIQEDDSVFASGDFTKSDTYKLKFKNVPSGTKSIRLEAIPDERLPANGPGTVAYEGPEGDFFLSNVKMRGTAGEIRIASATQSFASGNDTAAKAIDDDLQSGWAINGGQGRSHNAIFHLSAPVEGDLEIDLTCERYYAAGIGRFRIWVASDEKAPASGLPEDVFTTLRSYREGDEKHRETLLAYFVRVAPELASARAEMKKLRDQMPKSPTTLVLQERQAGFTRATKRHHRGEFLQAKEEVSPGVPSFLPSLPKDAPRNRLGFSRWLVSPENPLTGRVIMNRHWEAFFGRGLVRTLEDFGFQGELPSHPDLLDWLALEFPMRGWSQKQMHKLIVMSATYQQASAVSPELEQRDPLNILLARGPRFRVEAEIVRDYSLVVSGLFSDKVGGPSVYPPQPAGISTEGAYGPLQWKVSEGPDRYRRGLYTFAKRTTPFAMTSTFDGPSGEACLARRDRSNTPLQALTLLNDEVFMEASRALGKWAAEQPSSTESKVKEMFRRCVTRPPSPEEVEKLTHFYKNQLARFAGGELKASEFLKTGEASNEQAAWTALARVLLNLDETISKS